MYGLCFSLVWLQRRLSNVVACLDHSTNTRQRYFWSGKYISLSICVKSPLWTYFTNLSCDREMSLSMNEKRIIKILHTNQAALRGYVNLGMNCGISEWFYSLSSGHSQQDPPKLENLSSTSVSTRGGESRWMISRKRDNMRREGEGEGEGEIYAV